ncbi:TetR/AcrR family transcriptional regulator [Streptomyces sp. NPDC101234]|uniref:TetR/AcrR family transcriptional regulator n=1 Tax=Streptomyces sp. NPDC101234 TaxID=3366138 RepID=UPI0037F97D11
MTPSDGGLNPQVARSQAAALDAGQKILRSEGAEAVTYVTVAERSGVGRTTLYRHWPTIEHFLRDVLLRNCAVTHHTPTGATREDLIEELDGFRVQLGSPSLERPMTTIMDRASRDAEFAQLCGELYEACSGTVAQIVRTAGKSGDVDDNVDVSQAIAELAGPLVFQRLLGRQDITREFVENVVDDFLRAHRAVPAEERDARAAVT